MVASSLKDGVVGPGGQDIVVGPDGATWMLYHAWGPGYRTMSLDELAWDGDAPVLKLYSIPEFTALLAPFRHVEIVPERFPVASRLHKGWKAAVYNSVFVGTFNALPRSWVARYGWHLMAFCRP